MSVKTIAPEELAPDARASAVPALPDAVADAALAAIAGAARPIIFAGPQLSNGSGRALLGRLEAATNAPTVILESPRGIADATLGAFSDLVRRADLILLMEEGRVHERGNHEQLMNARGGYYQMVLRQMESHGRNGGEGWR